MECSKSTVVDVRDNDELMKPFENGMNPSGMAILFGQCEDNKEQFKMLSELSSYLLCQTNSCLNNLESLKHLDNQKTIGDIDSDLKTTIYQLNQVNQWMFNSFSVRNPELDELATFDRMELKNKLQRLVDIL